MDQINFSGQDTKKPKLFIAEWKFGDERRIKCQTEGKRGEEIRRRSCRKRRRLHRLERLTSQAEQGHTRVPSSPSSNWTQSIQQSSNLLDLFC